MARELRRSRFEQMCYDLENEYNKSISVKEYINEVTFIKEFFISKKINDNSDMLLKIKAEAEEEEPIVFSAYIVSVGAVFFSAMGVIIQFLPQVINGFDTVLNSMFMILIIIALIPMLIFFSKRFHPIRKWRKYILVAVNQFIESCPEEAAKQLHNREKEDRKSNNKQTDKKSKKKKGKKK